MTQQSRVALCRRLEKKELEQGAHVSAPRKPTLMVSCICPSKPLIFQACHPAWERKGQKAMEGVAGDIELDTEIKFEHLQTLFCFS